MPSYAKRAAKLMDDSSSVKQLNTHKRDLGKLIARENRRMKKA